MTLVLSETFSWRGRAVRWERMGSGPDVVFCHGTPWSSELWRPFAEALANDFTVYLWDMPGYGQSSKHAEHRVSLDVQGELLADLLTHWGIGSPHVVAHDYGGAVALRAHLLHQAGFASLALVDVVALAPWGSDFFQLVREHADVFSAVPPSIHEGVLRSYIEGASYVRLTSEAMVWGQQDTWIPVDRAHRLAAVIPGAQLRLVEGAGHLIQLDQPAALATCLTTWLGEQL